MFSMDSNGLNTEFHELAHQFVKSMFEALQVLQGKAAPGVRLLLPLLTLVLMTAHVTSELRGGVE